MTRPATRFRAQARLALSLIAWILFLPANPSAATLPGDDRFGLVGTGGKAFAARFGLRYYTLEGNYSAGNGPVFSSVNPANDPDDGFSVVREVAKLNVRTDSLGETNAQFQAKLSGYAKALASWYPLPSWARGSKPAFTWYRPDAAALAAAESLQIVETIRREKVRNPQVTGTVWEIGNEPNLFPAITPVEYATIFENFNRIIKAEDPGAKVMMGSVFIPEPAVDLKARLKEELETKMRAELQAAGLYNAVNAAGYFDNLVDDMSNTLLSRMLALSTREFLRQVLVATASRPDIVSLHVYPFDDRAPTLDSAGLRGILDTTFSGVKAELAGQGSSARLWITEFGNIEQGRTEGEVATRTSELVSTFRAQDAVDRWFHYKSTGSDEQFALFSTGTPPLTRLASDPAFAPATGAFSCGSLNAVGRAYYRESHGGTPCAERISFTTAASSRAEAGSAAIMVNLDAPSDQGVSVSYRVLDGTAGASDYAQGSGTVTLAAGETSKALPFAAVDDGAKEGDESVRLVLHVPLGATLAADSLHVAEIRDDDNGLPALDSLRPESPAVAEGDSVRVRIHASDPEGDALSCLWIRANGDTVGRASELLFKPGYRDAGTETLTVVVTDAKAGRSARPVVVAISNSALRPAILNPAGSPLNSGAPLLWGWPGGLADPDLETASLAATLEFYFDSASTRASHVQSGGMTGTMPVTLAAQAAPVWVRVKVKDAGGRESPWSDLRRLEWAGPATSLGASGAPLTVTLSASTGRSFVLAKVGLPRAAAIRLEILDADGSVRHTLFQGRLGAGRHALRFVPADIHLVPGIHLCRLTADGLKRTVTLAILP